MQEITDSFGWPAAIGIFLGTIFGLLIKNFYIGLGLGLAGAFLYVFIKDKRKVK